MTDTRIIQLTRGFETVVNTEDYYWLTRYKKENLRVATHADNGRNKKNTK